MKVFICMLSGLLVQDGCHLTVVCRKYTQEVYRIVNKESVTMVLFDGTTKNELYEVTLLLEKSEAVQLLDYLNDLLLNNTTHEHYHLSNDDYSKEITIALYDKSGELNHFAEKIKKQLYLNDVASNNARGTALAATNG